MVTAVVVLALNLGISPAGAASTRAYTDPYYLGYGKFTWYGGNTVRVYACDTHGDYQRIVVRFYDYWNLNPNYFELKVSDADGANNGCGSWYGTLPFSPGSGRLAAIACRQNGGDETTSNRCGGLIRLTSS